MEAAGRVSVATLTLQKELYVAKKRLGGLTKKVSLADVRRLRADGDGDSPKKPDESSLSKGAKGKKVHKARRLHDDGDSPKKPDESSLSKGAKGKKVHKARRLHDDGDSPKKARAKAKVRSRDGDGDSPKKTPPAKRRRKGARLLGGGAGKK
jgi:hypothetical protein